MKYLLKSNRHECQGLTSGRGPQAPKSVLALLPTTIWRQSACVCAQKQHRGKNRMEDQWATFLRVWTTALLC